MKKILFVFIIYLLASIAGPQAQAIALLSGALAWTLWFFAKVDQEEFHAKDVLKRWFKKSDGARDGRKR